MARWDNLIGTVSSYLRIGLSGVRLKNSSANLLVRNAADSADAEVTASKVNVSGNDLVLNSDAAGSDADWLYTLRVPSSGMTAAVVLTLPVDDGTTGQVLQTDGSGNLSFASAGTTAHLTARNTTTLAFDSSSPVSMFTLPANAVLDRVTCIIDTAFDGTGPLPSATVGVSGTTSKYLGATDIDLTLAAGTRFDIWSSEVANASTEALIITFVAGGSASAGSARFIVDYSVPA